MDFTLPPILRYLFLHSITYFPFSRSLLQVSWSMEDNYIDITSFKSNTSSSNFTVALRRLLYNVCSTMFALQRLLSQRNGRSTTVVEHTMEYTVEYTGRHGGVFNGRSTSVALTEGTNRLHSFSNFTVGQKLENIYAYFCIDRITEQIRHDRPYVVNGEKKILIYPAPGAELKGGPSTRCSIQWSTRWSTR